MSTFGRVFLCGLVISVVSGAIAANEPATVRPVDRLTWKNSKKECFWKLRHEAKLAEIAQSGGRYDVVLIGDSITHNWEKECAFSSPWRKGKSLLGKEVAARRFAGLRVLNLGIGGDGTSQVIWRCLNGELDGYETERVVLMIGTNNRRDSAEDVATGVKRIIEIIRAKQPKARILLNAILPRFVRDDDPGDMNAKNAKTNGMLKKLCDGKTVIWLDWGDRMRKADGSLDKDLWYDREHPSAPGYEIWADEILRFARSAPPPLS